MKKFAAFVATLLTIGALFAQTKSLDKNSAFYIYLKGSKTTLTPSEELDYAKSFEHDTYSKYKNDEFEWDEQFSNIKQSLKNKISEADLDSVYTMLTDVNFGDFDFTNEGFPVSIKKDTFFPFKNFDNWGSIKFGSILEKRIALKLDSFEKYNFFAMPKADAKTFLQGRKYGDGIVDREITLLISYRIAKFDSNEYNSFKNLALSNDYLPIVGIIEKIEVYDASNSRNVKKISELIKK